MNVPSMAFDSVDDVAGGEIVPGGEFSLAGGSAAEAGAFGEQSVAGGAVDGAVNAAAAEEGVVGGVDDGVDF